MMKVLTRGISPVQSKNSGQQVGDEDNLKNKKKNLLFRIEVYGVYLVVFCLPLYLVRFEIFNIPTTVLELMIYALFVFWLFKGFKFGEFKKLFFSHYSLVIAITLIIIGVSLASCALP